jgi:zinc protease
MRGRRGLSGLLGWLAAIGLWALAAPAAAEVPVSHFTLPNGLRVVFHLDRSDPLVAVAMAVHVGSAREAPGRTGFAHLFEHLLFLGSEHLGRGGIDRLSARIGGSGASGDTSRDVTVYHQAAPNDALEKLIWAEADTLGFFIGALTGPMLDAERQVVLNERRDAMENRAYGRGEAVLEAALYPLGHPYRWPVLGIPADVEAATLADVRAFHRRWYHPGNATLVIAGDFDPVQARRWVERYFGPIPPGPAAGRTAPRPGAAAPGTRLLLEDPLARLPELSLAWPTVPMAHADAPALIVLAGLLAPDTGGPGLAAPIEAMQQGGELAGAFTLKARGVADAPLDAVRAAIDERLAAFERNGTDEAAVARVRGTREVELYGALEGVAGRAAFIARYDAVAGRADFADILLARLRAVRAADVMRVYRAYIGGRPRAALSTVPAGQVALALPGSAPAVADPPVPRTAAAEEPAAPPRAAEAFDRSVEPPFGPAPRLAVPAIWTATLPNGLGLSGIESREQPLVHFELSLDGGRLRDDPARPGSAGLLARMMTRGTARRTPAQLAEALAALGATIEARALDDRILIGGTALARNFAATMALLEEMLLAPRWDVGELARAKAETLAELQAGRSDPERIARRILDRAHYGDDHILARDPLGTGESLAATGIAELSAFRARNFAPGLARLRVVGAIDRRGALAALRGLGAHWRASAGAGPPHPLPATAAGPRLYFQALPGAAQSVIMVGAPGPRRAEADHYPATVMNFALGGGGFASRLMREVREARGYTSSIRSRFEDGRFVVETSVRADATRDAVALIRRILVDYPATFSDADMVLTRESLTRRRARFYESAAAKLAVLAAIGDLGLPADHLAREAAILAAMTPADARALAALYLRPAAMTYVVVGDPAVRDALAEFHPIDLPPLP